MPTPSSTRRARIPRRSPPQAMCQTSSFLKRTNRNTSQRAMQRLPAKSTTSYRPGPLATYTQARLLAAPHPRPPAHNKPSRVVASQIATPANATRVTVHDSSLPLPIDPTRIPSGNPGPRLPGGDHGVAPPCARSPKRSRFQHVCPLLAGRESRHHDRRRQIAPHETSPNTVFSAKTRSSRNTSSRQRPSADATHPLKPIRSQHGACRGARSLLHREHPPTLPHPWPPRTHHTPTGVSFTAPPTLAANTCRDPRHPPRTCIVH